MAEHKPEETCPQFNPKADAYWERLREIEEERRAEEQTQENYRRLESA